MFPVLFSIGKVPISSFGLFLALAFLMATFLVWRLARAWDINEEKVLDLILLTFFGSLIGARLFFVSLNFAFFAPDLSRIVLITNYPGLSFWGGLLGGWITLMLFTRRFKIEFLQVADLAAIGLLGGLVLGSIGCFLGGCGVGISTNFLGVNMVGAIGKRFPIQLFEALIFLLILINFWPKAIRFHFPGKILSITLIAVGLTKFFTSFFRISGFDSFVLSIATLIFGIFIYYRTSKASFSKDLRRFGNFIVRLLTDSETRSRTIDREKKRWYTLFRKISGTVIGAKKLSRRLRVRPTPKNF